MASALGPSSPTTTSRKRFTKKPFNNTRATTARTFKRIEPDSAFISQAHLAKDDSQNVLQAHNAQLRAVAGQHDGQALASALHLAQGDLQPHLVVKIKRRLE